MGGRVPAVGVTFTQRRIGAHHVGFGAEKSRPAGDDAALAGLGSDGDAGSAVVLTAAEHTVAGLAGNRLTNREIANQLAVSTKTVEYHLSHIYAKLGVHSRNELARMIGATFDAPNGP